MAENNFRIKITGDDQTGKALGAAGQRFRKFDQDVRKFTKPLDQIHRSFEGIATSKGFGALDRFASRFGQINSLAAGVGEGFGGMGADLSGLAEAATAAAGALGAIAAAGGAAASVGHKWSITGSEIQRTADTIGMSTTELQRFRGVGKLYGVDNEAMTSSLLGLSDAMNEAYLGGKDQVAVFRALKIPITDAKGNLRDLKAVYLDLADALNRQTPAMRRKLAGMLGVMPALPAMRPGSKQIRSDLAHVPVAYPDGDPKKATAFQRQWELLGERVDAVKEKVGAAAGAVVAPILGIANGVLGFTGHALGHVTPGKAESPLAWALSNTAPVVHAVGRLTGQKSKWYDDWLAQERAGGAAAGVNASAAAARSVNPEEFAAFARRIEMQESGGSQFWRNGKPKINQSSGAVGVMQVLPETAARMAAMLGLPFDLGRLQTDAGYNRTLGQGYLASLLQKYSGDETLAAAAYNAGPGRLDAPYRDRRGRMMPGWLSRFGDPRTGQISDAEFARLIPFGETRNYVAATAQPQKVDVETVVDVRFTNAPAGTVATSRTTGGGASQVQVKHSMPAAS